MKKAGAQSVATDPYPRARDAYEQGASLRAIKRRLHLNDGELKDIAPDEFDDGPGCVNGY